MDVQEQYRWLFLYSLPCHLGRPESFKKLLESENFKPKKYLNGNYRKEAVRGCFLVSTIPIVII